MTVWAKAISWDKLKSALTCPLQLQYKIDKKPYQATGNNYHRQLGILVQKGFELYFNQRINLDPRGRTPEIQEKIIAKVLAADLVKDEELTYPDEKDFETFKQDVADHMRKGFLLFAMHGVLTQTVDSEKKWNSVFRGMRTFAMIDFQYNSPAGLWIYDGKGHTRKDADPRQVKYYALSVAAAGNKLAGAGFLYWNHDFEEIDVSPMALREFIETELEPVLPLMKKLRDGTSETLEPKPSPTNCNFCNWRQVCEHSTYKRKEQEDPGIKFKEVKL